MMPLKSASFQQRQPFAGFTLLDAREKFTENVGHCLRTGLVTEDRSSANGISQNHFIFCLSKKQKN